MVTAPTRKLFRAAGLITVALILSRLMGYAREAFLANRFGATYTADAYLVAQDLPASLFAAISTALVMVFIPVYRSVVQNRGEEAGWRLVNTVLNAVVILAVGMTALGWLAAPWVVPMLVPGLPDTALALAVSLTRIMLPMMLFIGIGGVASAVLNANRLFTLPALVGLASNMIVVVVLWVVSGPGEIGWVAWAVVAGAAAGVLIQAPQLPGLGYRYQPLLDLKDPAVLQIGRLILPVIVTTSALQLQNFVDRYLASGLAAGSISALNYAVRINALPYGVIGAAISTVLYPNLAEQAAGKRLEELARTVTGGLRTLTFILLPMAAGILVFREPIVQMFFQRGAFDPKATAATAYALQFYSVGILFFGWLDYLNRSLFALQDAMTPMWIGISMVVLNVGFNVALVGPLSHGGLALGTSLSTAVAVGLLLWRLKGRLPQMAVRPLLRSVAITTATAGGGALLGSLSYRLVAGYVPGTSLVHQAIRLGTGLAVIIIVHVGLSLAFGVEEGADMRLRLLRKLTGRKA